MNIKQIKGFPAYAISDDGRVFRVKAGLRGQAAGMEIKKHVRSPGYHFVRLFNGTYKNFSVHRLVAEAFIGEIGSNQVNHKDMNKLNNDISNLEICTAQHNSQQRTISKRLFGENSYQAKLSESDVLSIRSMRMNGAKLKDLAKIFSVSVPTIHAIASRRNWKHI